MTSRSGFADEICHKCSSFILRHKDDERGRADRTVERVNGVWLQYTQGKDKDNQVATHPSARGQSRLGPSTMAMLLGVILFTACCSDSKDKNWIRYLIGRKRKKTSSKGRKLQSNIKVAIVKKT